MKKIIPIQKSVKAKRHTRQYMMHKYFARRPYNVFNNLISYYTNEGDIVLDIFSGGGVTVFESVAQHRRSIGVDLNPLATFITKMELYRTNIDEARNLLESFISNLENKYGHYYEVMSKNEKGYALWSEWAYKIKCPECGTEVVLCEKNKIRNGIYKCQNQTCINNKGFKRIDGKASGMTLLNVKYYSDTNKTEKHIDADEIINNFEEQIPDISKIKYNPDIVLPLDMDRQYEDKLFDKGIKNYSDLFTIRNYNINVLIFNEIMRLKNELPTDKVDLLYFLFSSSLRYTNNMSRVTKNWENGNPTSMDKHAYWLPNQFVEVNIFDVLRKRMKAIMSGLEYTSNELKYGADRKENFESLKNPGDYLLLNQSSDNLPIPDNSVDVVITDPPYGSNVQYAELSLVWNVWFKIYSNKDTSLYRKKEAVMNRRLPEEKGKKDGIFYENILCDIFSEAFRVLKDNAYMVFTFNNKNINVWIAMLKAVTKAGFSLPEDGVLFQDYIESYKNTSHLKEAGNIQGDFIYSFKKEKTKQQISFENISLEELMKKEILSISKEIIGKNLKYTTTELYQRIFSKLTVLIMSYLNVKKDTLDDIANDLSMKFIDNILKENLMYKDKVWVAKS